MAHIYQVFNFRFGEYWDISIQDGIDISYKFFFFTSDSNLINYYEDQNEVGVRTSISHE